MSAAHPVVLGFDTSGKYCSAALFDDGTIVSAKHEEMNRGQAERLFPMLEDVLSEAGRTWTDLDALGVGSGPGNFTGIRIGISAARGLAVSLDIPAVSVPLMDALAENATLPALLSLSGPRDMHYLQLRETDKVGEVELSDLTSLLPCPTGTIAIGEGSDVIAKTYDVPRHPAAYAPGSAIARIAARRFPTTTERPTPAYLRPADAAPQKDAGISIIP